jgi:hypothetical protein
VTGLAGEPVLALGNGAEAVGLDGGSFGYVVTATANTAQGRREYRRDVAVQLTNNLLGANSPRCAQALVDSGGANTEVLENESAVVREVAARVRGYREPSDPATGLEDLADDELARWVAEHRDQLAACAVADSDMP